jgi:hypothetical protein
MGEWTGHRNLRADRDRFLAAATMLEVFDRLSDGRPTSKLTEPTPWFAAEWRFFSRPGS